MCLHALKFEDFLHLSLRNSIPLSLPRPSAVNESVMRKSDVKLNELQEAEEAIKREMLTMIHYDALQYPAANQIASKQNKRAQLPAR